MDVTKRKLIKYALYSLPYYSLINSLSNYAVASAEDSNLINILRADKELLKEKTKKIIFEHQLKNIIPSKDFEYFFVKSGDPRQNEVLIFVYLRDNVDKQSIPLSCKQVLWKSFNIQLELGDFGVAGDGVTDTTDIIEYALNSGISIKENKAKNFILTRTVIIKEVHLKFTGFGKGRTVFYLNHFQNGFTYGQPTFHYLKSKVSLSGFTIKRLNSANYVDGAGPKGLYVSNAAPLLIEDVEECYGLGYGIHVDYSDNVLVRNCYVHDHKGLIGGHSGTDGIHFYRSKNIVAEYNYIHNVGDDALSAGSFDPEHQANNIRFNNNHIISTKGGIKVYSYAQDIVINKNLIVGSREGGIYLTDDKNSPKDSCIKNVTIKDNHFFFVGVFGESNESGALRIRFWPKKNSVSRIDNVSFENNQIVNCLLGISTLVYNKDKRLSNLFISDNVFAVNAERVGRVKDYFINVVQCDESLIVRNNKFMSSGEIVPVSLSYRRDSIDWASTADLIFTNNTIA